MKNILKKPPVSKEHLTVPEELAVKLKSLLNKEFILTGKSRTDGSNIRKLIGNTLAESETLPNPAPKDTYTIVPERRKGVPKILLEYIDSYIVTSGNKYNLQVWNRNPATDSVQVQYSDGDFLSSGDVRFIFTKISVEDNIIESIVILTPDYIVNNFGPFGKPTIKNQLLINRAMRENIVSQDIPVLFHPDLKELDSYLTDKLPEKTDSIKDNPTDGKVLRLEYIYEIIKDELLGIKLDDAPTRIRGQYLETKVAKLLGYDTDNLGELAGDYPDIRHQMLEVKVQDSPTIDLGMYSPQFKEDIYNSVFTTESVRYLIALTNPDTKIIEGIVLAPGKELGKHFTYVAEENFKTQRTIDMSFFEQFKGEVVYNPKI